MGNTLTQERLKELFKYDENTGLFVRIKYVASNAKVGDSPGSINNSGYLVIRIDNKDYLSHRLVWLYTNGVFPKDQLDHKDGNRLNNRLSNLRESSDLKNQQNLRKAKSNNKSGFLGVFYRRGKWTTKLMVNGVSKYLGSYNTPEEAHKVYLLAKRKYHDFCTI